MKAILLLSGGLDSATVAAIAKKSGFEIYALSFDYGQRHKTELESAKKIAELSGFAEHKIAKIDLRIFGGSALTSDIPMPTVPSIAIPITYVPARNTIFLSYALAYAEVVGAFDIFVGVNVVDYSGYPDCRPDFIRAFEKLANLATAVGVEGKGEFKIHAPLIKMSKKEIIEAGIKLGVDYSQTHSCYDPIMRDEKIYACGKCESCQLRLAGFASANLSDPIYYF
jgi:7-cyano-7-deazaguanine synthase